MTDDATWEQRYCDWVKQKELLREFMKSEPKNLRRSLLASEPRQPIPIITYEDLRPAPKEIPLEDREIPEHKFIPQVVTPKPKSNDWRDLLPQNLQ